MKYRNLPILTLDEQQRFWQKVNIVEDSDSCWEWIRRKDRDGHGKYRHQKRVEYGAHRVAFLLSYGSIDNSLQVNHTCNNPACQRYNHMYQGNQSDNMKDRRDGKKPLSWQKLTWPLVNKIRNDFMNGVSRKEIYEKWKNISCKSNLITILANSTWIDSIYGQWLESHK